VATLLPRRCCWVVGAAQFEVTNQKPKTKSYDGNENDKKRFPKPRPGGGRSEEGQNAMRATPRAEVDMIGAQLRSLRITESKNELVTMRDFLGQSFHVSWVQGNLFMCGTCVQGNLCMCVSLSCSRAFFSFVPAEQSLHVWHFLDKLLPDNPPFILSLVAGGDDPSISNHWTKRVGAT